LASQIPDPKKPYTTYLKHRNINSIFLRPTDPCEIYKTIKNIKVKKSTGCDDISCMFLKKVKDEISLPVNKSLESEIVPKFIKVAKVMPIYKLKVKNQFCNYRPKSLLPVLSKVLEKVVKKDFIHSWKHTMYFTRVSMALETVTQQPKQ